MPKYLNNIDLNGNQLLSPVIHVSSQSTTTNGPAGNTTGTEGQIFYNSHSSAKALYFRDDSGWRPVGDISGVTAGAGLSGGGSGGTVSLAIDISEFSDVTPANGDKLLTLDSDGSTEQLTTIAALATLFAGSGLTATNSVIAVDTLNQNTTGSAGSVANALTVDNATVQLNSGTTYNGSSALTLSAKTAAIANAGTALATADQIHTFVTTQTDAIAASTTGNAATATKITTITNSDIVQLTATQTLTNKTIAASQVTEISGITTAEGNQIKNIGSTTISATQWGYLGDATGAITNTDVDVSVANLKTALGDGFPDNTANIGDSDDTITVPGDLAISGDLTVTGDTITTNVTTVSVKDPMIRVANNNAVDSVDFGLYGTYQSTIDGTTAIRFSGVFRDASEDTDSWTFFKDLSDEPGATTVNTAHSTYALADIKAATAKFTTVTGNGSALTSLNGSNITSGTIDAGRVATLNQDTSGNAATATKISSITNSDIVQLTDSQTLTNKTLTSPVLNTGVSGTAIKDEDNMTSNSATHLATQQSIKAYVDSQTSGNSNTGGRNAFVLNDTSTGVAVSNLNKTYTITHGMGDSLNYGVEVIRGANGSGETVYTDVTRTTTTIVINFAVAPTAGDYTALVCKY
jgi:hypothetical protein